MSYIGRYNRFIDALKDQKVSGEVEIHHIVPRSLGGSNDESNLIKLTLRQHYIAHWMLWKAYGGKMAQAFFFLNNKDDKRIGSKAYARLREDALTGISGENHYLYGKEVPLETRQKMSEKRKAYMADPQVKEQWRKYRQSQVISAESYKRQAETMSSLIWMNDNNRSYRIRPELVEDKLSEGLVMGRLMNHLNRGAA